MAFLPLAVWTDACFPLSDRRFRPAVYTIHAATALGWVWTRSLALPAAPTAIVVPTVFRKFRRDTPSSRSPQSGQTTILGLDSGVFFITISL